LEKKNEQIQKNGKNKKQISKIPKTQKQNKRDKMKKKRKVKKGKNWKNIDLSICILVHLLCFFDLPFFAYILHVVFLFLLFVQV
jgi:hypothetical protein